MQNPDNPDELYIDLGEEICNQLGWSEGDTLIWKIDENNNIIVVRNDDNKS